MVRFFYKTEKLVSGQLIELSEELLRHIRKVLRLEPGSECELLDGSGGVARIRLDKDYRAEVLTVEKIPPAVCALSLIQGLPKGEKLELVLQKGTELGISRFLPTQMERSISRLVPEREQKRIKRWQKIIQEAARQSGQAYLPELDLFGSLSAALDAVEADLKLILWEESEYSLEQVLTAGVEYKKIAVIVGPEGGITPAEVSQAQAVGFKAVSVGPRILRTETAGLAIMAVLQYLYGDLAKGRSSYQAVPQGKDES